LIWPNIATVLSREESCLIYFRQLGTSALSVQRRTSDQELHDWTSSETVSRCSFGTSRYRLGLGPEI